MLLSAVVLAACVLWALGQPGPEIPTSPRALGLLLIGLAVYATAMALRGARWSSILRGAGIRVSRAEPYALITVGYMGNTVLPLRGGEVLRVVLLSERSGCGWKAALGSIIPERILDVVSLVVLMVVVLASGTIVTAGTEAVTLVGVALLLLAGAGLALYRRLRARERLDRFASLAHPFAKASKMLLTARGLRLGLVSLMIWTLEGVVFWLTAEALQLSIGLVGGIGLAVVATAFSTIPAGPAYAGTYDASLLVALRSLGVSGGPAISYVLMVRFLIFVPVTIVGLVVALTRYGALGRLRRQRLRYRPAMAEASSESA
jgi:glycosyltransferase 2 family protein